jgi:hypothetical protein
MAFRKRSMAKEFGTAFAVLAIYVLTLLAPLHQVAAQQRELAALGFESLTQWSVCAELAQDNQNDTQPTAVQCPLTGVGKQDFAALEPTVLTLASLELVVPRFAPVEASAVWLSLPDHKGQSRAPPELA